MSDHLSEEEIESFHREVINEVYPPGASKLSEAAVYFSWKSADLEDKIERLRSQLEMRLNVVEAAKIVVATSSRPRIIVVERLSDALEKLAQSEREVK